jgi:hypothetical protein
MSERQVRRVESGDRLTVDTVEAFAAALRIHPNELLDQLSERLSHDDEHPEALRIPSEADGVLEDKFPLSARPVNATHPWVMEWARAPGESLQLAADSSEHEITRFWSLEAPKIGNLRGVVEHDPITDELVFLVTETNVSVKSSALVSVVAWSSVDAEPLVTKPFLPRLGARIPLGVGRGIVPGDLTRVELRTADEPGK